mmetsp:Transcript_25941/g.48713  ORF Transcript_25941/g.48713 Transcript_25941/m.48713 type:complete len:636 (+) Transcript_25941:62-1969(+)
MAESVDSSEGNADRLVELLREEFEKLGATLVRKVREELRLCLKHRNSLHPSHVSDSRDVDSHHLAISSVDGTKSRDTTTSSEVSQTAVENEASDSDPATNDWLYRPGKAFAPSKILRKIGEEDMQRKTSSFGGIVKLKRRFSGQALGEPVWDEENRRFIKDLSQHSSLRAAALPSVPDMPNVPAPPLEVEPAQIKAESESPETVKLQTFQSKSLAVGRGSGSMEGVFSFHRSSQADIAASPLIQRIAWKLVTNMFFETISMFMLCANSLVIGVQTDYMASNMVTAVPSALRALDILFCVFFAVELTLRITAFGRKFFVMTGCGWNIMDMILVTAQVAEELLMAVAEATAGSNSVQYNTEVMRVVRILRAIKVVRLVGAVRFAQDLQLLINCLFLSLKQFLWSALLLLLAIYVVAIYITQAATAYRLENQEGIHLVAMTKWWGSMPQSVLSLFQGVAGGVDWHQIADPLITGISPWFGLLFIVFMAFCILALLNVITGTFVETMSQQARDLKLRNRVLQARRLFVEIDIDGSGFISPEEVVDHTSSPAVQEFFESIDVHPSEARRLLEVIDIDGNGKINFEEFLEASLRLNGNARSSDLILLAREMKRFHASQIKCLEKMQLEMRNLFSANKDPLT